MNNARSVMITCIVIKIVHVQSVKQEKFQILTKALVKYVLMVLLQNQELLNARRAKKIALSYTLMKKKLSVLRAVVTCI